MRHAGPHGSLILACGTFLTSVARIQAPRYIGAFGRMDLNGFVRGYRAGAKPAGLGGIRVKETGVRNSAYGADKFGFKDLAELRWNLPAPALYEYAIAAGEATVVEGGALTAETGHHTGRSPKDKHTVVDDLTRDSVWWDGNRKMSKENFDNLLADFQAHAKGKKLFV